MQDCMAHMENIEDRESRLPKVCRHLHYGNKAQLGNRKGDSPVAGSTLAVVTNQRFC